MLISVASMKGSPGVTTTALVLAAVWPRPVVLLEADPSGGDLAYRCTVDGGGSVSATRGLLHLAAAVRTGDPDEGVVLAQSDRLACGVHLIHGVTRAAQSRALPDLWPTIASTCLDSDADVIVDLGRLDRTHPVMAVAEQSTHLLLVATATLESVMHLRENLQDLVRALTPTHTTTATSVCPVIVGPDAHASHDRSDLDRLLAETGVPVRPSLSLPVDSKAVARLEHGESPSSRLGRTLLLRAARRTADSLTASELVSS